MSTILFLFISIFFLGVFLYILKSPVRGVYLTAFFLPFEYIGSFEWRGITIRPSQICALMTMMAWFFDGLARRSLKFVRNPIFTAVSLYLIVNILSLGNALNFHRSLLVLLFIVFTVMFGFSLPNILINKEGITKALKFLLLGAAAASFFGLYQFISDMAGLPLSYTGLRFHYSKAILGFTRVQSMALEPLYFANFLFLPICLSVTAVLSGALDFFKRKWVMPGLLVLFLVNFILTVSRGAYLGLLFAFFAIFIFYRKSILKKKILRPAVLILLAAAVISSVFLGGNISGFAAHLADAFSGAAYGERMETFSMAIDAWQEHPILGIGAGGFGPWVYVSPFIIPEAGWKIVNNLYLEILTESGILGLLFFAAALVVLFIRQIKAVRIAGEGLEKALAVGLLAAFLGMFIQYNTFSIIYIMHVWFLIGAMLAIQNFILKE